MPQSPTTVVFDIGNVLIRWKPEEFYLKILKDDAKVRWFMDHVHTVAWNIELDLGPADWDAAFEERIRAFPEWEEPLRAYQVNWFETLTETIEPNVALLRHLKSAGTPLYALTNFNDYTFRTMQAREYDFLNLFDGIIVSGEDHVVKPDPAIFSLLFNRYNLVPETCVFIDDSAANIAAAKALGMHTIHFVEPIDAASELARMGLSVAKAQ